MTSHAEGEEWMPLNPEALVAAPCLIEQTLCVASDTQPQLAKDLPYAQAVLDAWRLEDEDNSWQTEWRPIQYQDADQTTTLYGHLIRKTAAPQEEGAASPGVVFFHTGAGPHDLFLLYKAASLVNQAAFGGVVILVADILSDDSGWAWSPDRTRYNQARQHVLQVDENGQQPVLRQRVQAALETLQTHTKTSADDANHGLAVLGWCLGGHPVLQAAQLQHPAVRALATFHGVFDQAVGVTTEDATTSSNEKEDEVGAAGATPAEVLICHGAQDPFVSADALEHALGLLQTWRYRTSLLQLSGAKHGFTNPAQDFNDNPAFAFDGEAASKAWKQTLNMLQRTLFPS